MLLLSFWVSTCTHLDAPTLPPLGELLFRGTCSVMNEHETGLLPIKKLWGRSRAPDFLLGTLPHGTTAGQKEFFSDLLAVDEI